MACCDLDSNPENDLNEDIFTQLLALGGTESNLTQCERSVAMNGLQLTSGMHYENEISAG